MTKTEKAAARALHQQKLRELTQQIQSDRVNADLAKLGKLRHYLIFKSESRGPRDVLLETIDDYVEALTGDRTKLHDQGHSIGYVYPSISLSMLMRSTRVLPEPVSKFDAITGYPNESANRRPAKHGVHSSALQGMPHPSLVSQRPMS